MCTNTSPLNTKYFIFFRVLRSFNLIRVGFVNGPSLNLSPSLSAAVAAALGDDVCLPFSSFSQSFPLIMRS